MANDLNEKEKSIDNLSTDLFNIVLRNFPNMRERTKKRLRNRLRQFINCFYSSIIKS